MANFYQILGLPNFASSTDVRKAFRRLAVQYHPDKHKGHKAYEEKFKSINLAYQTLSDASKKSLYDQKLLYGTTQIQQKQETGTKPKYGRAHEPIVKEAKQRRKEPELKHTILQTKLMKATGAVVALFLLIAILFNLTDTEADPKANLRALELKIIKQAKARLRGDRFLDCEKYLDTLDLINKYSDTKEQLQRNLFYKIKDGISLKSQGHKSIIQDTEHLLKLSKKYQLPFPGENYLFWAEELISTEREDEGIEKLQIAESRGLTLEEACLVSDIYLDLNKGDEARRIITKTKSRIFQNYFNTLGPGYFEKLKTREIPTYIQKEMLQFVVLNANNKNKVASSLLHDLLLFKFKETEHNEAYATLLSHEFVKESIDVSFVSKHERSLKYFNLYYYFSKY